MSMGQTVSSVEEIAYWVERFAKIRAELDNKINERKFEALEQPIQMPIATYDANGKLIQRIRTSLPVGNLNVEAVNKRTDGLGKIGNRIKLSKKDWARYQEVERRTAILSNWVPPQKMRGINALVTTMRSNIASLSSNDSTSQSMELLRASPAVMPALPVTPQPQGQESSALRRRVQE